MWSQGHELKVCVEIGQQFKTKESERPNVHVKNDLYSMSRYVKKNLQTSWFLSYIANYGPL